MRWPFRKKLHGDAGLPSAGTPSSQPDQSATPLDGADAATTSFDRTPHRDRSHPRADWARLGPPVLAIAATAPVTFNGAGFGRSVAGARSITSTRRRTQRRDAPSGLAVGIVQVDAVLPHGDDRSVPRERAGEHSHVGVRHRRPVVDTRRQASLTTSDIEFGFTTVQLTDPFRRTGIEPVSWTPETGFISDAVVDEQHLGRIRRIARKPVPDRFDVDPAESADDDGSDDVRPGDAVPVVRFVPVEGPRSAPPHDLIDAVLAATGVHVGDAVIDRTPESGERAADLGALAFAQNGTVHVPVDLGPIDEPVARAAIAHELTHIAQQRAHAGELPPEGSPAGRRLEAQARAVQRRIEGREVVVPAFLRPLSHRPEAPVGIQRLANDAGGYLGEDLSEQDYSTVTPGSASDPFAWQDRQNEPVEGSWDARREWDRSFEQSNAATLQSRRHQRFHELALAGISDARALQRQLDSEMPYQFGPPFGTEPYPELPDGGAAGASASTAAAAPAGAPASTPAETNAGLAELREIASRAAHVVHGEHDGQWRGDLPERLEHRFARERELRLDVLNAKRGAAIIEHQAPDHVVELTESELAQIRAAVDLELPLDARFPQYVAADEVVRISVAGEVDARVPTGARAATMTHRTAAAPTSPATASAVAGTTTASLTHGVATTPPAGAAGSPTDATPSAATQADGSDTAPEAADQLLTHLLATAATPPASAAAWTTDSLPGRLEARFEYERQIRRQILTAKITAAVHAGQHAGATVTITADELARIHELVERAHPLLANFPQYLATDEHMSHTLTEGDLHAYASPGQAAPAAPAAPTAAAAAPVGGTADPTAADATADHADATHHDGAATGEAALGAGTAAVHRTPGDHDHDAETSARVVEMMTDLDLDLLTRRLWGRIRRELRAELLVDRERSGRLADVR